jgi:hypothetical protein
MGLVLSRGAKHMFEKPANIEQPGGVTIVSRFVHLSGRQARLGTREEFDICQDIWDTNVLVVTMSTVSP